MKRDTINVALPIEIEAHKSGLFTISSPVIKGLLVAATSENEARNKVHSAVQDLALAAQSG